MLCEWRGRSLRNATRGIHLRSGHDENTEGLYCHLINNVAIYTSRFIELVLHLHTFSSNIWRHQYQGTWQGLAGVGGRAMLKQLLHVALTWDCCGFQRGVGACSGCQGWAEFKQAPSLTQGRYLPRVPSPSYLPRVPRPSYLPLHAGVTAVHCPEAPQRRELAPLSVNPVLHPK